MAQNAVRDAFELAFQVSPIILTGGIANNIGGYLPIVVLTEAVGLASGLIAGQLPSRLDQFVAQFVPARGATLIANEIGQYTFANQVVAANAIIQQPLKISMVMIAPARGPAGYPLKLPVFTALQLSLQSHNQQGGTYTVATPSSIYTNCIMTQMADVTGDDTKQRQARWRMDFTKPLVSQQQAQVAYNSLMGKLANGTQISGQPTWVQQTTPSPPPLIPNPGFLTGTGALY